MSESETSSYNYDVESTKEEASKNPQFNDIPPSEMETGYSSLNDLLSDLQGLIDRSPTKWDATINCYGKYHLYFTIASNGGCRMGNNECQYQKGYSMKTLQEDIDMIKKCGYDSEFSINANGEDSASMTAYLSSSDPDECILNTSWRFDNLKYQVRDMVVYGLLMTGFLSIWKYSRIFQQEYPEYLQVELI